jgi:hypothetical protein
MKRRFQGLSGTSLGAGDGIPDGIFLARVDRAQYSWQSQKPYYAVRFSVLEPNQFASRTFTGRLYCTPKALWKLSWFLRDFGYDAELLGHDEIEDKRLVGLPGVVKISHVARNGISLVNLDAFAPAAQWHELSSRSTSPTTSSEVA